MYDENMAEQEIEDAAQEAGFNGNDMRETDFAAVETKAVASLTSAVLEGDMLALEALMFLDDLGSEAAESALLLLYILLS